MLRKIRKAWRILKEEGSGSLARRVRRKVWQRRDLILFARDLRQSDAVPFLPRHPCVVRFVGSEDLKRYESALPPEKMRLFEERFAKRQALVLVLSADESTVLGWVWLTDKTFFEPYYGATFRIPAGECHHFDGAVMPGFRGRGVAFAAFPLMWSHCRARGCTTSTCSIEETNRPSLKLHRRLGYVETGRATLHRFLMFKWMTSRDPRIVPGDVTDSQVR